MIWRLLRSRIVIFIVAAIFILYLGRVLVAQSEIAKGGAPFRSPPFAQLRDNFSDVATSPQSTEASQSVKLQPYPLALEWLEDLEGNQDLRWPLKYARRDYCGTAETLDST